MKIAFATTDGISIDEHFGRAGMFAVYDITEHGHIFLEMRKFSEGRDREIEETKGMGAIHDDLVQRKVERLADCRIIYLTEIGGPSVARLVKKGIMPIKVREDVSIEASLGKLVKTLGTAPPPWLRKALAKDKSGKGGAGE